ncbi:MAG TPA: hypothetical protein VFH70_07125, partial [Acidimicrobiales bacterium]|nr:hypothetical protein [Acidimicrobiales bacterium]
MIATTRRAPASSLPTQPDGALGWDGWRFSVAVFAATVAFAVFATFFLPTLLGDPQWLTLGDARFTAQTAQYVANGGAGYVYSANTQFLPLPGFPILLAPFVRIGQNFGLQNGYPFMLQYPSMWLIIAPLFALFGSTAIVGVDFLAATLGIAKGRRRVLAVMIAATVVLPTVCWAGHPEDLLALTLSAVSLAMVLRQRHAGAAVVLALAVLMQPWALLFIPLVAVAAPVGFRLRSLFYSSALPGLCGLTMLALDWKDAYRALILQPMQGLGQHLPWWSLGRPMPLVQEGIPTIVRVGSGPRALAVLTAIVGAWLIRRCVRPDTIMLVAAAALAARGIFETQVWCYYLAPAGVFLVLAAAMSHDRRGWVVGGLCGFVFYGCVAASYDAWQMPSFLALAILCASAGGALLAARQHGRITGS